DEPRDQAFYASVTKFVWIRLGNCTTTNAVRSVVAGAPRDARPATARPGWRGIRTRRVRVRQRGRGAFEELPEGVVHAATARNWARPALGTVRQIPALLSRAAREIESAHARSPARSWQPTPGARCRSSHRSAVPRSREHLDEQPVP